MVYFALSFLLIALGLLALGLTGVVKGAAGMVSLALLLFLGFAAASIARVLLRRRLYQR
jgi:hypothetical protein